MKERGKKNWLLILVLFALLPTLVNAGSMPWDSGLASITESVTGPTAAAVSLIGVVAAGAGLIFMGQEMGAFMKSIISIVLVVSIIMGASSLIKMISGKGASTGATIAYYQDNSKC